MKFEIDPSEIKSSWDDFAKYYDINPNCTSYPKLMEDMITLQNDDSYPNILFPDEVVENSVKIFRTGDYEPSKVTDSLYLKSFLSERYKLFGQQLEDERIEYLYKPRILPKPVMKSILTTKTIEYKDYHLIFWLPFLLFIGIPVLIFAIGIFVASLQINSTTSVISVIMSIFMIYEIISLSKKFIFDCADRKIKTIKSTACEIRQAKESVEHEYATQLKNYEQSVATYGCRLEEYSLKQKENMHKIESRFDKRIREFNKYYKVTKSLSAVRAINCPQRGRSENLLFELLMEKYPKYVKIDMQVGQYFPDICIIIPQGNITLDDVCIDIEIDEPYAFGTKEETHYIGCGDEIRNDFFNENGWYVIRFTEEQVLSDVKICLDIISNLIIFLENRTLDPNKTFSYLFCKRNQIKRERWSKEQARMLAIHDSRLKRRYEDFWRHYEDLW